MNQTLKFALFSLAVAGMFTAVASADMLPVGYISWDVTSSTTGAFDISNETGVNSSGDATFPITSTVNLSSLSLSVDFSDGSHHTFGSSYFTLNPFDGISFNGNSIPTGGANPQPIDATLTGDFSPTSVTLFDGTSDTIGSTFSATIDSSSGPGSALNDGDLAVINATTGSVSTMPEPSSWLLLASCAGIVLLYSRRNLLGKFKVSAKGAASAAVALSALIVIPSLASAAPVHLNVATSPSTGGAGQTQVNVTGSGFPAGVTAPSVTVTIASSCGGPVVATTTAMTVTPVIGSSDRIHFLLPGSLGNANYFVSVSGTAPAFTSGNCSEVQVTHTTVATFCAPGSSLGVNAPLTGPAPVTAYVPNASWDAGSFTGIQVQQIEPAGGAPTAGGPHALVATPNGANSCGVDPTTGTAVCTSNGTDVYILNGTTLTNTLTSGATGFTGFSGGECMNCGLAINGVTHQAVITEGLTGSPSASGIQFLDLASLTFGPTIPLTREVSEDITIDPARGYIVSPDEEGYYNLIQFTAADTTKEFNFNITATGHSVLDSAAEDCSTGIGLSSLEEANYVYLTDFTQAVFVPGTPGTWSAPQEVTTMNVTPYPGFSAGTDGIAVAPGGSHLAVITGEFGGNTVAVLQLPPTAGSGTPTLVDYAVFAMPGGFVSGLDPHTMTAYTSPNNGKAYGLFSNGAGFPPTGLWVVDMEALLAAPRYALNPNAVDPTYDLIAHGVVTVIPL